MRQYNHLKEKTTDFIDDEDTYIEESLPKSVEDALKSLPEDTREAYLVYLKEILGDINSYVSVEKFEEDYEGKYDSPEDFVEDFLSNFVDNESFKNYYLEYFIDLDSLGKDVYSLYEDRLEGEYDGSEFIGDYEEESESPKESNPTKEELLDSQVISELEVIVAEGHRYDSERIARMYLDVLTDTYPNIYGLRLLDYIEKNFGKYCLTWDEGVHSFFDGLNGDFVFCDGYVFNVY